MQITKRQAATGLIVAALGAGGSLGATGSASADSGHSLAHHTRHHRGHHASHHARHHKVDFKRAAEAALLRFDVAYDAYSGEFYATNLSLGVREQSARTLLGELARALNALSHLQFPARADSSGRQFAGSAVSVGNTLKQMSEAPDATTFANELSTLTTETTGSQPSSLDNAEDAFRTALGLPKFAQQSWFGAQPAGKLVYRDTLAAPDHTSDWHPQAPYAVFAQGGFVVSAPAGGSTIHGPSSPYSYDGRYIDVQVDATPAAGQPIYGLACPEPPSGDSSNVIGVIEPGGRWAIGTYTSAGHTSPPSYTPVSGASSAISTTGVNHLRLDCEQFAPGLAIARLYDNGSYLGYLDVPLTLASANEPGTVVISGDGNAASAKFTNWSVSELSH